MTMSCASHPLVVDGRELLLVAKQEATGAKFWVEFPKGKIWLHINEPVLPDNLARIDPYNEIVALTFDDRSELIEAIGHCSDWFIPTGRVVDYPRNQQNEVWRLSPSCIELLNPPQVTAALKRLVAIDGHVIHDKAPPNERIGPLVRSLLARLRPLGYSAMFMARPGLASDSKVSHMVIEAASTWPLLNFGLDVINSLRHDNRNVYSIDLADERGEWATTVKEMGFRCLLIVRIPVVAAECYNFVLCSTSFNLSDSRQEGALMEVLRVWPSWREHIQSEVCPLTAREREALRAMASGLTGAEACKELDCSERTFRMHSDNARRKLGAANGAQALHRAHLLCAL